MLFHLAFTELRKVAERGRIQLIGSDPAIIILQHGGEFAGIGGPAKDKSYEDFCI